EARAQARSADHSRGAEALRRLRARRFQAARARQSSFRVARQRRALELHSGLGVTASTCVATLHRGPNAARMCFDSHSPRVMRHSGCAKTYNSMEIWMLLYILNAVYPDTETTHGIYEEDICEE